MTKNEPLGRLSQDERKALGRKCRSVLTDRYLKSLKPARPEDPDGRYIEWDEVIPQLGVKVDRKGVVTFVLQERYPPSKNPTRREIGRYGVITLEKARKTAEAWLGLIKDGKDPRVEKEKAKAAQRRKLDTTFTSVLNTYATDVLPGQRKGKIVEKDMRREFEPSWGGRPITDITDQDVVAVVKAAVRRGAPYQAHNLYGHARSFFDWAINEAVYGLDRSPCDRLRPKKLIGEKKPRQRKLEDPELVALFRAVRRLAYPYGKLVQLLAITAARKSELGEARWREFHPELVRLLRERKPDDGPINWAKVDPAIKILTVPPERFKSDAEHIIALTDEALAIVETLPMYPGRGHDFLFTTTFGKTPINGYSKYKARLDREMLRSLKAMARKRGEDHGAVELKPWVLHDLRRVVRTAMSAMRVDRNVAEYVLGHGKKGLDRTYDEHHFLPEMREALELWSARLRGILEPPKPEPEAPAPEPESSTESNVVRFRGRAGTW